MEHNSKYECFSCLINWLKILNSPKLVPEVSMSVSWVLNLSWCDAAWLLCFVRGMLASAFSMIVMLAPWSFEQCDAGSWNFCQCGAGSWILFRLCWLLLFCQCEASFLISMCVMMATNFFLSVSCWLLNLFLAVWCWLLKLLSVWCWPLNFIFISEILAPELYF